MLYKRRVRCIYPWRTMCQEAPGTHIRMCCWSDVLLGDLRTSSLEEIWNGELYQDFRRRMLEDDLSLCMKFCPIIVNGGFESRPVAINGTGSDYIKNQDLMWSEIESGKVILETRPSYIKLYPTPRCNLKCVMCYTVNKQKDSPAEEMFPKLLRQTEKWYNYLDRLEFVGGEPLISKDVHLQITNFPSSLYPDCKLHFITNGTLLFPDVLANMIGKFRSLSVSIDAATKTTYEKLRKGADWDTLMTNMKYLAGMENRNFSVHILTVVMRSNIDEIIDIAAMANSFGMTVGFHPCRGDWHNENIISKADKLKAIKYLETAHILYPDVTDIKSLLPVLWNNIN